MENNQQTNVEEYVYTYSRREAIADGVLVDVSELGKEAGIKFPIAMTATLWHEFIEPNEKLEEAGQSSEGRLWDVLNVFVYEVRKLIKAGRANHDTILFKVLFLMEPDESPKDIQLKGIVSGGDDGKPVFTIMLPKED